MMARNGESYFLIQVLKKGAHMDHNYPDYILEAVRQNQGLEEDDTSRDKEFQTWSPEEVFEAVLEWEGLIGYSRWILDRIEDIFNVSIPS